MADAGYRQPLFLSGTRAGQLKMEDEPRQKHKPPRVDVERGPDRAFLCAYRTQAHAELRRLARSELVLDVSCRRRQTWKSLVSSRLVSPRSLAPHSSVSSSADVLA